MPELLIKYKNKKTLEALMDFSKYFDFSVILPSNQKKEKTNKINGVTIVPGDSSVDTTDLGKIFSGKNLNAKQMRQLAWQRGK